MARIRIDVTYMDNSTSHHLLPHGQGWRVNSSQRCLVLGSGVPRLHIPFDNVKCFGLVELPEGIAND